MRALTVGTIRVLAAAGIGTLGAISATTGGSLVSGASTPGHGTPTFGVAQILAGDSLQHSFTPQGSTSPTTEPLSNPDDITQLGDHLFVGFQNGVGPQGQASADGNLDSTIVELTLKGRPVGQWDIVGKTDGVTADPEREVVIATVNEDANSALYTITPSSGSAVTRYSYNEVLPHDGGTDAISVYRGHLFISASAPGTTGLPAPQPTYPAVYSVTLDSSTQVASVVPLFSDEDSATIANLNSAQYGQTTPLALTDPDSNEVVPSDGPRFGGDFVLTSQGDQEQIYVRHAGRPQQRLAVLSLSQSVDDTAWPTGFSGRLYSTDSTNDRVDVIIGPFSPHQPLTVATPCGANTAPATCPSPPSFPANYLATLNPWTGQVQAVATQGVAYVPQGGLVFVGG